ncbi:hypothetical protein C0Q70_20871 [Pomacea canaliculata]|uniref:Sodium-coupled monocarboxylate transporter 1 n=1 Tax=Pomacea canaliculata TaxID=400727 RepID=A0A2T7NB03_POMCA|nr:hypothetical protein C0Q70_20871 [Pomacea canaliculata]
MVNVTIPFFFLTLTMACYEGIISYSYYHVKGCDPLGSKKITNPNQIIPFTVMDIFQNLPGMPGLFLASLFSASLSTLSSGLSSLSALLWADILKPRVGNISDLKATIIAKVSVVVFGLLSCGVALLVSLIGGPLTQIAGSLLSAFGGPLTGLFMLGCFCPWANAKGAFIGGLLALIFSSWLSLGMNFTKSIKAAPWLPPASMEYCYVNSTSNAANFSAFAEGGPWTSRYNLSLHGGVEFSQLNSYFTDSISTTVATDAILPGPQGIEKMYTVSYMWLASIGIFFTIIAGSIVSFLTGGNKPGEVHPRYLMSFFDHLFCYLPESVRKHLRCGEDYTTADMTDYQPPTKVIIMDTEIIITPDNNDDKANEKETMLSGGGLDPADDIGDNSSCLDSGKLNGSKLPLASFLAHQEDNLTNGQNVLGVP